MRHKHPECGPILGLGFGEHTDSLNPPGVERRDERLLEILLEG